MALLVMPAAMNVSQAAGTVVAWGAHDSGQTSVPANLTNVVAVAGGAAHSLALKGDGTVAAWGMNLNGQTTVPAGLNNATRIAAGASYSMALKSDGTVTNWGAVAAPAGLNGVKAIAAGWYHALALRTNGAIVAWGAQTDVPAGLTNAVAIAAGDGFSVAVRSDTTVTAWGASSYGATEVPPGLSNVKAIAAGEGHCLALLRDGTVVGWGRNDFGQATVPTNLGPVIAISAGALHSIVLKSDGTLFAWGNNTCNQTNTTTALNGFIGVAAGQYHNLAIQGDNSPFILLQPVSQNVALTATATLQVTAAGATPLSYRWQHACASCSTFTNLPGGTNLPVATNASLVLTNFQITDGGQYAAVVANAYGSVTSQPALLVPMGRPPTVTLPLTNQMVICGDTLTLAVSVDGTGPFGYQWRLDGNLLADATGSSLNLTNVTPSAGGFWSVVVTNSYYDGALGMTVTGAATNGAEITVSVEPPAITSPLAAFGQQGEPFSYTITALHNPLSYSAPYLPAGLTLDPAAGVISGTPLESGVFNVLLGAHNACAYAEANLVLSVASSAPVITSPLWANGTEGQNLTYQITATRSPAAFGAQNLPIGLQVNSATGFISGAPTYAGTYYPTIWASNQWGAGSATLRVTITNGAICGLSMDYNTFTYRYHAPYLLDFTFTLRDEDNPNYGNGIVTAPSQLAVTCLEGWPSPYNPGWGPWPQYSTNWPGHPRSTDWVDFPVSPTETGIFLSRGSGRVLKTYLVLDYSASISDPISNGDSNGDGISDAVDYMVAGARYFVEQQSGSTQLGVYEFHREDADPINVTRGLTRKKAVLDSAIAGIWTNNVNWFYGGSRCWDALDAAVRNLGPAGSDEQHCIVVVSDGRDYSSTNHWEDIVRRASANGVQIYCIAFGDNPDLETLHYIEYYADGRLYYAPTPADLYQQFSLASKDLQAQYILRWATLRRDASRTFGPSFSIQYQGLTAATPPWVWGDGGHNDTHVMCPHDYWTNEFIISISNGPPAVTNWGTNVVIFWAAPIWNSGISTYKAVVGPYNVLGYNPAATNPLWYTNGGFYYPLQTSSNVGSVTSGSLRLVPDEEVDPTGVTLRATYIPRGVRQLCLNYRVNWPCAVSLAATNVGDMLHGWTLTSSPNADGSTRLLLSSPNPASMTNSLPYVGFGPLVNFTFQDPITNLNTIFSAISVDNSIYQGIPGGGQSFSFEPGNTNGFVTSFPPMPRGTSVPWLIQNGLASPSGPSNAWAAAELQDNDHDGAPNWQEYRAGTDPSSSASCFKMGAITRLPNGYFLITFTTGNNRTFGLQSSTDLLNWQTIHDNVPGNNGVVSVIDSNYYPGANTLYYRAVVY